MPDTSVVHVLHSIRDCEEMHDDGDVRFRMDDFEVTYEVYQPGDLALITAIDGCVLTGVITDIRGPIFTVEL